MAPCSGGKLGDPPSDDSLSWHTNCLPAVAANPDINVLNDNIPGRIRSPRICTLAERLIRVVRYAYVNVRFRRTTRAAANTANHHDLLLCDQLESRALDQICVNRISGSPQLDAQPILPRSCSFGLQILDAPVVGWHFKVAILNKNNRHPFPAQFADKEP